MASRNLDSPNAAVRGIERWKRGMKALAVVLLFAVIPGALGAGALMGLNELVGRPEWEVFALAIGFGFAGPWVIGDRQFLRMFAVLANEPDHREN